MSIVLHNSDGQEFCIAWCLTTKLITDKHQLTMKIKKNKNKLKQTKTNNCIWKGN